MVGRALLLVPVVLHPSLEAGKQEAGCLPTTCEQLLSISWWELWLWQKSNKNEAGAWEPVSKAVPWYPGGKGGFGLGPWPWCWILKVGRRNNDFCQEWGKHYNIPVFEDAGFLVMTRKVNWFFLPVAIEIIWNLEQVLTNISTSLLAVWPPASYKTLLRSRVPQDSSVKQG